MKRSSGFFKSIFSVLFVLISFCVCPQMSYADAPQDVKIEYNSGAQTLTVTITHKSLFPGFHHIKNVEIKKNTTVIGNNNYDTQPKEASFTYTYKVAAAQGDKLEVTATCNLSGSKTARMNVP